LSATAGSQEFKKLACEVSAAFTSAAVFFRPLVLRPNQQGARLIKRAKTQLAAAGLDYAAGLAE